MFGSGRGLLLKEGPWRKIVISISFAPLPGPTGKKYTPSPTHWVHSSVRIVVFLPGMQSTSLWHFGVHNFEYSICKSRYVGSVFFPSDIGRLTFFDVTSGAVASKGTIAPLPQLLLPSLHNGKNTLSKLSLLCQMGYVHLVLFYASAEICHCSGQNFGLQATLPWISYRVWLPTKGRKRLFTNHFQRKPWLLPTASEAKL